MEKLKIQISEVEGVSIKIPTEFTAQSYRIFYNQMLAISRSMPTKPFQQTREVEKAIVKTVVPSRLNLTFWGDEKERLMILELYEKKGKDMLINWMEETREIKLTNDEKSNLSRFVAVIRAKYKVRSAREW